MSRLIRFEENITSVLILVLTILTLLQVIVRYLFKIPLPWVGEVASYLMIWMVYIGSAIAVFKKEHLNIEILDLVLTKRQNYFVGITHQILITLFSIVLVYTSSQFITYQVKIGQVSPAMQISMAWPMSAIVVGAILMTIHGIHSIYVSVTIKNNS